MSAICNGWQLAVVDWDMFKKNVHPSHAWLLDEIDKTEKDTSGKALASGEVVYICSVASESTLADGTVASMAYVWSPSRCMYMTSALGALHPIVTPKDAIEMNLKFGLSLGADEP